MESNLYKSISNFLLQVEYFFLGGQVDGVAVGTVFVIFVVDSEVVPTVKIVRSKLLPVLPELLVFVFSVFVGFDDGRFLDISYLILDFADLLFGAVLVWARRSFRRKVSIFLFTKLICFKFCMIQDEFVFSEGRLVTRGVMILVGVLLLLWCIGLNWWLMFILAFVFRRFLD